MLGNVKHQNNGDDWAIAPVHGTAWPLAQAPAQPTTHHTPTVLPGGVTIGRLLKQAWLMIGICIAIATPLMAAAYFMHVPLYSAKATVSVSPTKERVDSDKPEFVPRYQQYLNDQAARIASEKLMQRVLDRADVKGTRWFREAQQTAATRLSALRQSLSIKPRRSTSLIDIKIEATSGREAALIANAVMDEYLDDVKDSSAASEDVLLTSIENEMTKLRGVIEDLNTRVKALRSEAGHWTPEELLGQQRMRLDAKEAEREELVTQLRMVEDRLRRMREEEAARKEKDVAGVAPEKTDTKPETVPYESDPEWRARKLAYQQALDAIELETHLGDAHPQMVKLQTAARQAAEHLRMREEQLDTSWEEVKATAGLNAPLTAEEAQMPTGMILTKRQLEYARDDLQKRQELKLEEIAEERERVVRTADQANQLQARLNELDHHEKRYEELRDRKVTMLMERRAPASIRTFNAAVANPQPVNTRREIMMFAVAIFAGVISGLSVGYLRAMTTHSIQDIGEVPQGSAQAPFLGLIPFHKNPSELDLVVRAEHVRMLRTSLLQRMQNQSFKRIQITSAGPGAGKSTLSFLLAESLAQCGKKVLLVDCDFRNPTLHKNTDQELEPGLINILHSKISDTEAIRVIQPSGIHLLTAGRMKSVDDTELLAKGILCNAVKRWMDTYDIILFDSSPLLPVADARILAGLVDGSVLVVREKHCERRQVSEAMRALNTAGANILGMVFVGRRDTSGHYYGDYYGDYYRPTESTAIAIDVRESN
jgi:succinoglycan biosynthesis transport protein ExoP